MRRIIIIAFGILQFGIYSCSNKNNSFENQLKVFTDLGYLINDGITNDDIINIWGKERIGSGPFVILYLSLGSEIFKDGNRIFITDNCWHFDTECIEDTGSYVSIIKNLGRISNGELDFKNISDIVDWDNEKASISFEINNDIYDWELEFYDDWVDPGLFTKIVQLTKKYNTNGRFT